MLETLYKRTKTGAIQVWKVCVEDLGDSSEIIKGAGQLGGKITEHRELITKGKNIGRSNETTPHQQAMLQAESDFKKKKDEGYKSLSDLNINNVSGNLLEELNNALPQFNTDASGNVKPMLAKAISWDKVKYPCYAQPKLDGVRCLMVFNEGEVKFLSRNGKEYTSLSHIARDVHKFASEQNFILDGEVYSDELSFQEIISAVKKASPESLKLKFRVYDMVSDEIQEKRWWSTLDLVYSINSSYIIPLETIEVDSKERVKELHDLWVSQGCEGAMVRLYDGVYGQGQRSSSLLKVKEFDDAEFKFVRWETGQREEDLIAVCLTESGAEFSAKMIGTREEKAELKNTTGKQLTVKYFGMTDDGLPRFPIGKAFRDE